MPYEINSYLTNDLKDQYEIILINDSSQDNSWNVVQELSSKHTFVKGVNLEKNIGQHGAIFVGLKSVIKIWINLFTNEYFLN